MKHPSRSPVQKKNAVTSEPLPLSPRTSRGTRYGSSRRRRTPPSPSQPRPASTPLLRGRHPTTAALSTHPHPLTQLSLRRRHLDLVRSIPAARITLLLCSPRAAVFTHPAGFAAPRWQGLRSPPTPATPAVHLRHLPSPHAQLCLLDEFVLLEDDRFFLKLQGRLPSSSLPPWDAMEMKLPSTREFKGMWEREEVHGEDALLQPSLPPTTRCLLLCVLVLQQPSAAAAAGRVTVVAVCRPWRR
ncbi:hypothetical protein VPH35_013330 [Triticum aestivum]